MVGMAMGTRKQRERQADLWIATSDIVQTPGHVFYERLNAVLRAHRFDAKVEHLCRRFYRGQYGRPSLAPGVYFRLLLVGFFEGLDSERAIAWRLADSLSLRTFIGYGLDEPTPDHSTISRTRRLFWLSTHQAVFRWVLKVLAQADLLVGTTISVDATTLEANAAMRSIVRRDSGQTYQAYVTGLAQAAGLEDLTREQLARFDRKRTKTTSNRDWTHPHDPDARVTKMKDGRTHLAHKVEHGVDLATGALVAVTLQPADRGDTSTILPTLAAAQRVVEALSETTVHEAVADRGYHSGDLLEALQAQQIRTYIAEPDRGRRHWAGKKVEQQQVYANRRRLRGSRSKRLQRLRSELTERSFAHLYDTGGMRRVHLRGRDNILKRLLVHGAGFNLALLMRTRYGAGKPRQATARLAALTALLAALWRRCRPVLIVIRDYCRGAARAPIMSGSYSACAAVS